MGPRRIRDHCAPYTSTGSHSGKYECYSDWLGAVAV